MSVITYLAGTAIYAAFMGALASWLFLCWQMLKAVAKMQNERKGGGE